MVSGLSGHNDQISHNGAVSTKRSPASIAQLEQKARKVRASCVQMAFDGREGHLSSALSCTDLLVALYNGWLNVSPDAPKAPDRDRFYFSKGHACTALCAALADAGFMPKQTLSSYGKTDSPLPNHSLLGVRAAASWKAAPAASVMDSVSPPGALYGLRLDNNPARAVVLMSDGECNEGSVWESAMFAAAQKLGNLLAIVDNNGLQAVGRSDVLMGHTSLEEKISRLRLGGPHHQRQQHDRNRGCAGRRAV